MTEEAFIRLSFSLLGVVGVAILAITLGGQFGLWAAGLVLLIVGFGIGIPLWLKHLENQSIERMKPKTSPVPEKNDELQH